jgi:lipopolysaccharide/colanic/teichoic acid biosynthesis glycosyltransferase
MDLVLCLLALPFALPLIALLALLIYLDSPGPAILVQERVGRGGRRLYMYKFRTMNHNVDGSRQQAHMRAFVRGEIGANTAEGAINKPDNSRRITRLGRILRKTSLDEVPQLFNVLKGEMSLVGPRPNLPWEVENYEPWHKKRLEVLPGITGLAQVRGRSRVPFERIVRYDIEYIENWNLLLDLRILLWTIPCVLFARGAG